MFSWQISQTENDANYRFRYPIALPILLAPQWASQLALLLVLARRFPNSPLYQTGKSTNRYLSAFSSPVDLNHPSTLAFAKCRKSPHSHGATHVQRYLICSLVGISKMNLSSSSDLYCWLDQYRISDCGECEFTPALGLWDEKKAQYKRNQIKRRLRRISIGCLIKS
jgi:hypothetical protein